MKHLLPTSLFAAGAYKLTLLAGTPAVSADAAAGAVATPHSAVSSRVTAALAEQGRHTGTFCCRVHQQQ
jgi:hypothetical protein